MQIGVPSVSIITDLWWIQEKNCIFCGGHICLCVSPLWEIPSVCQTHRCRNTFRKCSAHRESWHTSCFYAHTNQSRCSAVWLIPGTFVRCKTMEEARHKVLLFKHAWWMWSSRRLIASIHNASHSCCELSVPVGWVTLFQSALAAPLCAPPLQPAIRYAHTHAHTDFQQSPAACQHEWALIENTSAAWIYMKVLLSLFSSDHFPSVLFSPVFNQEIKMKNLV